MRVSCLRCPAGRLRRSGLVVLISVGLVVAGCGGSRKAPGPELTSHPPRDTVARAQVGDRLLITATVERVLGAGSFVARDVDLPPEGLLVIVDIAPDGLRSTVLVQVDGVVAIFRVRDFPEIVAGDASPYGPFEGKKALVAARVRVW